MKICGKCGVELREDARYCKACGSGQNGPGDANLRQEKKARVLATGKRLPRIAWIAGVAAALLLSFWAVYAIVRDNSFFLRSSTWKAMAPGKGRTGTCRSVKPVNGTVKIPAADLDDGKAHFYFYESGAWTVRFFALRRPDGSVGVALDACNACYRAKLGYRQDGDHVVCNNCGMAFRPEDVGIVTGGCNPIPLAHTVVAGAVTVKDEDLQYGRKYF